MSRSAWVRLAHVGMHPDRLRGLVEDADGPVGVLRAIERGTVSLPDAARAAASVPADERTAALQDSDTSLVLAEDPAYPPALAGLADAPFFLFVRGSVSDLPAVAIVGTRRCTRYGLDLARAFGRVVSEAGWSVVSGLARGIDGAAHHGSLSGSAPGTAVLGCGIDRWYPAAHAELGESLLSAGGAVLSEYPPGTPPTGWRFPPRNRIISGLARVVVIVEAAATGGALITALRALEQDRVIFAVPGDVTRPSSEGCNLLIRDGAVPVLGPADLIEALSIVLGLPQARNADVVTVGGMALPDGGVPMDELAEATATGLPDLLVEVGRLVADGLVVVRDGRVCPAR